MTIQMNDLEIGQSGTVLELKSDQDIRTRLLELGLIPGSIVNRVFNSTSGDPSCYNICGAMIALRDNDTKTISVEV